MTDETQLDDIITDDSHDSTLPVNRLVVLLTPLVFAPAAGAVAAWLARHFPGLPAIDPAHLTAIFATGALTALGLAAHWLHGWQKHETAKLIHGFPSPPAGTYPPDETEPGTDA